MSGLPFHHKLIIDINQDIISKGDDDGIIITSNGDNNDNTNDDNVQMTNNVYQTYVADEEDDDDEEYQDENDGVYDDDDFIDDSEDEDYYEPSLKRGTYGDRKYSRNADSFKHLTPQERKLREDQLAIKREKARERRTQRAMEEAQIKENKRKLKRELRAQGLDAKGQPLPEKVADSAESKLRIRRLYHEEFCFSCGCAGITVKCDACPKVYHTDCLNEAGIQYVLSSEGKWICPWHSCTTCKKSPVKAETGGLIWDEIFQSQTSACTNCTCSYCDACLLQMLKVLRSQSQMISLSLEEEDIPMNRSSLFALLVNQRLMTI